MNVNNQTGDDITATEVRRIRDLKNKGKPDKGRKRSKSIDRSTSNPINLNKSNISGFFHRNFSLKKDDKKNYDLSLDVANPGVLKIFCTHLQRGADYKSVLFTDNSSAGDIVAEVLDRFAGSDLGVPTDYVLCDVVGNFTPVDSSEKGSKIEQGKFDEVCLRTIQPEEVITHIMLFWKPFKGFRRRFEIRKKFDLEKSDTGYGSDNETRGVNSNARHILRSKAAGGIKGSMSVSDLTERRSTTSTSPKIATHTQYAQTETKNGQDLQDNRIRSRSLIASVSGPHLILLKGYDSRKDTLVHRLLDINILGSGQNCDITLYSRDLPQDVCHIQRESSETSSQSSDSGFQSSSKQKYHVYIHPSPEANVPILLNTHLVLSKTKINPGDYLNIDGKYVFLYKDPDMMPDRLLTLGTTVSDASQMRPQINFELESNLSFQSQSSKRSDPSTMLPTSNVGECLLDRVMPLPPSSAPSRRRGSSSSCQNQRSSLSSEIVSACSEMTGQVIKSFLGPEKMSAEVAASFLIFFNEYISLFEDSSIVDDFQKQLREAISDVTQDTATSLQNGNGIQGCTSLYHFAIMCGYLLDHFRSPSDLRLSSPSPKANPWNFVNWSTFYENNTTEIFNDLLQNIAEITLGLCPAIHRDNPFVSPEFVGSVPCTMQSLLRHFTSVNHLFLSSSTPMAAYMKSALFYRLLIFMSEKVVSDIIADVQLLQWSRGVQMRGNLDKIEEWLKNNDLDHMNVPLAILSSVIDLLATPKTNLYMMTWDTLRNNFPSIPVCVLHRVLLYYENGRGPINDNWAADPCDLEDTDYDPAAALQDLSDNLLRKHEIFHRPIARIQLREKINSAEFTVYKTRLDAELQNNQLELSWKVLIDHVISSSRQRKLSMPGSSSSQDVTRSINLMKMKSNSGSGSNASVSSRSKPPITRTESVGRAESKQDDHNHNHELRRKEIEHLRSITRSLQNICSQQSSGASSPMMMKNRDRNKPRPNQEFSSDNRADIRSRLINYRNVDDNIDLTSEPPVPSRNNRKQTTSSAASHISSSRSDIAKVTNPIPPASLRARYTAKNGTGMQYYQHLSNCEELTDDYHEEDTFDEDSISEFDSSSAGRNEHDSYNNYRRESDTPSSNYANDDYFSQSLLNSSILAGDGSPQKAFMGEDIFTVILQKDGKGSLGLGIVDGETTSLNQPGIYVRSFLPGSPAEKDGRVKEGDRILGVNDESIVGRSYECAMDLLLNSSGEVKLLIAKSDYNTAKRVLS